MFANFHTHTYRCGHACGTDREYIEEAVAGGIKVLGFSDHCPWVFDDGYVSGTRMSPAELDGYFYSLTSLKREYSSDIDIYIGFESEYIPELMEAQDKLLADYPLDYMILGEHFTQREPYSPYTGYPSGSAAELERYVDLIIEGMDSGRYFYTAHPDLFNFTGSEEVLDRQYRRLCRYFKEKGLPAEINLLGLCGGRHYPSGRFFDIAAETGLKAVIGCDAHSPDVLSDRGKISACVDFAEKHGIEIMDGSEFFSAFLTYKGGNK